MPNPYGITEVDIPGAIAAHQAYQNNRIQQMLAQRQIEAADRQADRDLTEQTTIARITGRGNKDNGAMGAYQQAAQPSQAPVTLPVAGAAPAAPATAPATQYTPAQIAELRLAGPRGAQVAEALQGMNEQQLAATMRRSNAGLQVALGLQQVPVANRANVFRQNAQLLQAQGFTPQELQQLEAEGFSDEVLRNHAQTSSLAARFASPAFRNVEGEVLDERLLGTGQDPRVYSSEFISTPQGMGARPGGRNFSGPQASPPPPAVGTVQGGYRFRGGDPASPQSWEPAGGAQTSATPAWATPVDGGAGPGQQNFR